MISRALIASLALACAAPAAAQDDYATTTTARHGNGYSAEQFQALGRSPQATQLERLRDSLAGGGLRCALQYLNRRTPHRFTGVFRFDGSMLRSVELVDKWLPETRKGEDIPIASALCSRALSRYSCKGVITPRSITR